MRALGPLREFREVVLRKTLLWALLLTSFACVGYMLWRLRPEWLLPAGLLAALALSYELVAARWLRRRQPV